MWDPACSLIDFLHEINTFSGLDLRQKDEKKDQTELIFEKYLGPKAPHKITIPQTLADNKILMTSMLTSKATFMLLNQALTTIAKEKSFQKFKRTGWYTKYCLMAKH